MDANNGKNKNPVLLSLFLIFISFFLAPFCHAADTITQGQSIKDGQTLISVRETFELGFFSPENSTLRYVGIWYHDIEVKSFVWVANRANPISDRNGVLRIANDGNLEILDGSSTPVWTSNASVLSNDTAARLLDTGDFELSSNSSSTPYWRSFDHPTDTYLPGMSVLVSSAKGENRAFSSWKSANDPSPGNYTMGIDPHGALQIVIWKQTKRLWRSGYWNGQIFTGIPNMTNLASISYGFKLSQRQPDGDAYFSYVPLSPSDLLRFKITWDGHEEQLKWEDDHKNWNVLQTQPANECELYNYCGNFGICNVLRSPKCRCMKGFEPKFRDQWDRGNWTGGCQRRTELQCQRNNSGALESGEKDRFRGMRCSKLPDFANVVTAIDSDACGEKCLQNCSCNAYAHVTGIGCMMWTDLIDIQHFDNGGNLMFIRLDQSELDGDKLLPNFAIVIIVVGGVFLLCISIWLLWRFKGKLKALPLVSSISCCKENDAQIPDVSNSKEFSTDISGSVELLLDGKQVNAPDLPLFNFSCIAAATNNFSEENKLGQGGFGPVYKGELPGGQEIAVKRLSGKSGQGLNEFKNEIILIAKLQHRNLVRLLGCCIQGEENMLIYEYMPNKSLDYFLFDPTQQAQLDWRKRLTIIEGIARGLLYLHRDSRLRIIHRDLKPSNILLDAEMNPKISDFGMARIFGGNQDEGNTVRVVGTYGYMSPEYAMEGLFSVKSDVYSFGVILLEIVSGRRNTSFRLSDFTSLIAYAWSLWSEDKAMELVDPSIRDTCNPTEVLKCIHIGMLCVQDSAICRPTMASVVVMLESEPSKLAAPRQPNFTSMRSSIDTEFCSDCQDIVSSNDMTVTMVLGR